jgi:hypothetical protein
MRILASSPDTLTDLVLRQPLFASLTAAGHELYFLCAPDAAPLVPLIAPGVRVSYFPVDGSGSGDALQPLVASVRDFRPELWLLSSGPTNPLEALLASYWPDVPMIGKLDRSTQGKRDHRVQTVQMQQELQARRAEQERIDQSLREREAAVRTREERIGNRELELKARYGTQLLAAQSEVDRAEARERDLQIKLEQLQREHATLLKHCEKLRGELNGLQGHVNELAGSRWRRIGMKIGIAKQTTWEVTHPNGN